MSGYALARYDGSVSEMNAVTEHENQTKEKLDDEETNDNNELGVDIEISSNNDDELNTEHSMDVDEMEADDSIYACISNDKR